MTTESSFPLLRTARLRGILWLLFSAMNLSAPGAPAHERQTRQVPVDGLIYDLKNPDALRRREAAKLLGDNKVKRAIPDLVAVSADTDATVRRAAIFALASMGDMQCLPAFVRQSGDPDKEIREKCVDSLLDLYLPKETGLTASMSRVANLLNPWSDEWADVEIEPGIRVDASAIGALRERLGDPEDGIRIKSCRALGILKGRDALPDLTGLLENQSTNELRFEAIRAIRKIGDPGGGKALMNYLSYSDAKVRNEAVFTVGRLRYAAALSELTRLFESESAKPARLVDKTYQDFLLDAIACIADPASKQLFIKERMNPDDSLRLRAIEGLARLGESSLVTEIARDWLAERDSRLQTAQSFALYRMGRPEYLDDLVRRLGSGKTSADARRYLLEFRLQELPDLYAQAGNKETAVREGLVEILGLIGDKEAIPVLQELGRDDRGRVAALANQALRRVYARTGVQ
jgi:HEAT repeat protein